MEKVGRYSGVVGNMGSEDLDLLECLLRIDQNLSLDDRASALLDRLVEGGFVDREDACLALTTAGIERCAHCSIASPQTRKPQRCSPLAE